MNSVYLRKGDTVLVHARIENASISINNSHFKAIFFNDFKIVLELLKSNLQDKGRYTCVATNGTAEMIGKNYLLQVDGKIAYENFLFHANDQRDHRIRS